VGVVLAMSRDDPVPFDSQSDGLLLCDVTQSWSAAGGGVGTYLRHKRRHIMERTGHRHLLIVPGDEDRVEEDGRAITATIASPKVPGSPNYRLLLRNRAVRGMLAHFRPDLIECQDAYNLPWAAIGHARRNPGVALVAAYCTDFPTVYVGRTLERLAGPRVAKAGARLAYRYCASLYRRFDALYAMSEHGGAAKLRSLGLDADVVPLGVELGEFGPHRRDESIRETFGANAATPLIVYAGRLDREKRAWTVVEAFRALPRALNARLLLIGDGPLREPILAFGDERIHAPGFVGDRSLLAALLASGDVYASGMADETFGISIVEAQASGLPVVGVRAGAMIDRVGESTGLLGPVDDAAVMADNIRAILTGDRRAMAAAAVAEAHRYSWDRSMDMLFGQLYPLAQSRARWRTHGAAIGEAGLARA
jgi:alpha-1,6-mannosyltransferase